MQSRPNRTPSRVIMAMTIGLILVAAAAVAIFITFPTGLHARPSSMTARKDLQFAPHRAIDSSGFINVVESLPHWKPDSTLEEIGKIWQGVGHRSAADIDQTLANATISGGDRVKLLVSKAMFLNYEDEPALAYEVLEQARLVLEQDEALARDGLYTVIYLQGVAGLRRGESENCVMCRGESSCILPIAPAAVHTNAAGSRLAIRHFTEYLEKFPSDQDARWLLNVAHMTLGEYPQKVDSRFVVSINHFLKSEFDIGKFRDVGEQAKVNRFNMAGGALMEDFDNDGLLDLATTSFDPTLPMLFYRNAGDGTFTELTEKAGLGKQLGGKNLVQTDFDNDGHKDIFVSRGAWLLSPIRQSLLRNNGDGTFSDVTERAGLLDAVNSTASCWADYDNDGWLDVYIICEKQTNRLYHNRGNGTFEEVSASAGVANDANACCKGANWIDFDNDDFPDLFVDNLSGTAKLYHNSRNGTFTDVTESMGIDGPKVGFSCWAWDFNNDGWLDIFATSYDQSIGDIVSGLNGEAHHRESNRLWRNANGRKFENVIKELD